MWSGQGFTNLTTYKQRVHEMEGFAFPHLLLLGVIHSVSNAIVDSAM